MGALLAGQLATVARSAQPSKAQDSASSGVSLPSLSQPTRPLNIISAAVWTPPLEVTAGFKLPGSAWMATTSVPPLTGAAVVGVVDCWVCDCCTGLSSP